MSPDGWWWGVKEEEVTAGCGGRVGSAPRLSPVAGLMLIIQDRAAGSLLKILTAARAQL